MRKLTLSTVLFALLSTGLVAGAACSKNKKPATATATAPAGDGSATTETAAPTTDTAETTPAPAAASLTPVVYFEFDSSTLSEEARKELEENAEWLKQDPRRTLTIEGHTDEVGTTEYNVALGERRARAAYDYLVRLGIDGGRVEIISLGEERPASPEDAQNRRAMFIATKK